MTRFTLAVIAVAAVIGFGLATIVVMTTDASTPPPPVSCAATQTCPPATYATRDPGQSVLR